MNLAAALAQVAPNWRHPIGEMLDNLRRGRLTYFVYLPADIVNILEYLSLHPLHSLRRDRGSYLAMAPAAAIARIVQLVTGPYPHIHHMRRDYPSLERLKITGVKAPPRYHHDGPLCYVIADVSTEYARHTSVCWFNYDDWYSGRGFSRKEYTVHGYIDYCGAGIISVWHLPAGIRAFYDSDLRDASDIVSMHIGQTYPYVRVYHYPLECGWHLRRSESITKIAYFLMDFRGNHIEIAPEPIFASLFFP